MKEGKRKEKAKTNRTCIAGNKFTRQQMWQIYSQQGIDQKIAGNKGVREGKSLA